MAPRKPKATAGDEAAVREKIAGWPAPYRAMGERIHEIITETVPELRPRLWYGMPGYAKAGPVLCFLRVDDGVMSLGMTEKANISVEAGAPDRLVPCAWFLTELDAATETAIAAIVRRAAG